MSNDTLTRFRQQADNARARYREEVDRIKKDKQLSDVGRKQQIAATLAATREHLRDYQQQEQTLLATSRAELERKLFGPTNALYNDPIATRDAATRASQLRTPEEAANLLEMAEMTEDSGLAQAVARRAIYMSDGVNKELNEEWSNVFRTFLGPRQHLAPIVEQLGEIEDLQTGGMFSPFHVTTPATVEHQYVTAATNGKEYTPPDRTEDDRYATEWGAKR